MDGTPAIYFYKPATSWESQNTWVVYLQGGGWCLDQDSCDSRCWPEPQRHCSSDAVEADTRTLDGVFLADDPLVGNAHKAYLIYCTSDAHVGDTEQFDNGVGGLYQFRGQHVVAALFDELVHTHGLGAGAQRDRLIFGGTSAGARGAMYHLDYVPELLGPIAAASVDVIGLLDSPLWLDMDVCTDCTLPGTVSLPTRTQTVFGWVNATARLGPLCKAALPAAEQWKCLLGEYRLQHMNSSFLVIASQADTYIIDTNMGGDGTDEEEGMAYALAVANRTKSVLGAIYASHQEEGAPPVSTFSQSCSTHANTISYWGFDSIVVNAASAGNALSLLLQGTATNLLEQCEGFACTPDCKKRDEDLTFGNVERLALLNIFWPWSGMSRGATLGRAKSR